MGQPVLGMARLLSSVRTSAHVETFLKLNLLRLFASSLNIFNFTILRSTYLEDSCQCILINIAIISYLNLQSFLSLKSCRCQKELFYTIYTDW